jgi:hypothetical protein
LQKIKEFKKVKFDARTFSAAHATIKSEAPEKLSYSQLSVESLGLDERWTYDSIDEFLAAADRGWPLFIVNAGTEFSVIVHSSRFSSTVRVTSPKRDQIEKIHSIFENNAQRCRLP